MNNQQMLSCVYSAYLSMVFTVAFEPKGSFLVLASSILLLVHLFYLNFVILVNIFHGMRGVFNYKVKV